MIGFWIFLGLIFIGFSLQSGLSNIARAIFKKYNEPYFKDQIKYVLSGPDDLDGYKKMLKDILNDTFGV